MNNIKMENCNFYVNKEKRTIVCVIPETKNMFYDFVDENFQFKFYNIGDGLTYDAMEECYWMPESFSGKAVCAPDDEWNEELGRRIAFSRAKHKCYKSFFKRANRLVSSLDTYIGYMLEQFNAFGKKCETNKIRLDKLIDQSLE